MATGSHICPKCGTQGYPKTITHSSVMVELVLWFLGVVLALMFGLWLLLVPLIFSIWRGATAQKGCPQCRQAGMVPVNTPAGGELAARYQKPDAPAA